MTHPFKVSDKVVAIGNTKFEGAIPLGDGDDIPIVGKVYVVEDVDFSSDGYNAPICDLVGMRLTSDCSYEAANFRKLDDIKQEIISGIRAEGILHHSRKLEPIILPDESTKQDRINAARNTGLIKTLEAMEKACPNFRKGIFNE